jgi:hypothetical protein
MGNSTSPSGSTRISASIVSTGMYVPSRVLTNAELEKMVETTDEWIMSRTGIRERRIAADDEFTSDMGAKAAQQALELGGIDPQEIDLIIVATCTSDTVFPATACYIQSKIGAMRAAAFDVQAACSGFLYALVTADQFIAAGVYKTVMVIGAEKLSSIVNWQDRNTCVLFGDGAGAVILRHRDGGRGLLAYDLGSDGSQTSILSLELPADVRQGSLQAGGHSHEPLHRDLPRESRREAGANPLVRPASGQLPHPRCRRAAHERRHGAFRDEPRPLWQHQCGLHAYRAARDRDRRQARPRRSRPHGLLWRRPDVGERHSRVVMEGQPPA